MVEFLSLSFFLFVAFTLFGFHVTTVPTIRFAVLVGSSFVFVASFFRTFEAALPISGLIGILIVGVFVTLRSSEGSRSGAALFFTAAILGSFLVLKDYLTLGVNFQTVGISYVLFRGIQLISDAGDGALQPEAVTLERLTLFSTSFLTFAAGPIQHYEHFGQSLQKSLSAPLSAVNWQLVSQRTVSGAIKLCLFTPLLSGVQGEIITWAYPAAFTVALACSAFLLYIFVSFSGYMDWVIAFGAALNFNVPDNFDSPHRSENFLDLWNRWHLTLSRTFRIYVFNPLIRLLMMRVMQRSTTLPGLIGFFVVFFLLGYWHGNDIRFAVFGLLLGTLASLTKVAQNMPWPKGIGRTFDSLPPIARTATRAGLSLGILAVSCIMTWPGFTLADALVLLDGPVRTGLITILCICFAIIICALAIGVEELVRATYSTAFGGWVLRLIPLHFILFLSCVFAYQHLAPEISDTLVYYQRF